MIEYLRLIADGASLSEEQAESAMHLLMRGEAEPEETAAFLMGLRSRGEKVTELTGFTRVMRDYAVHVDSGDPDAIDLCGTGGDNTGSFNISTAAALVCAGAGVTVAKHGNRSVSSKCGSADVLEALGVNVELRKNGVEYCLREAGIAFLFAPFFHPALRFVMPVRRKLGVRTFFNILGPLANPAGVRRQLIGAFNVDVARQMAAILARVDAEHVMTVHSLDGMDELSLSDRTTTFEYRRAQAPGTDVPEPLPVEIQPEHFGLNRVAQTELTGGNAAENAAIVRSVLNGTQGPHLDVVLLNAAFALSISGRFENLGQCFEAARDSIYSGHANGKLDALIAASREARMED